MKLVKEIGSWLVYIVIAFVVAAALNIFVFQITRIQGSSMVPTLESGDLYVISKIGHTIRSYPDYEDIVVIDSRTAQKRTFLNDVTDIVKYNAITSIFTHHTEDIYWVKRVIGLPGDEITFKNSAVYRNGERLAEPYVNPDEIPEYNEGLQIIVPDGYVFVMGDNRNHSSDSRVIGPVPIQNVMGTLKFKIK